jgi:hypothetical protein
VAKSSNYYFAGLNKDQLRRDVRGVVDARAFGEEFESDLIADLIAAKHYYCSVHHLRPVRFRKDRSARGYDFMGYFPGHGWHSVSWEACIRGRNPEDQVERALRTEFDEVTRGYLRDHPRCERCAERRSNETHHADPTFKQIRDAAIAALDEDGWRQIAEAMDWWSKEPFRLPRTSPALAVAKGLHQSARLEALCEPCHDAETADQRRAGRPATRRPGGSVMP